MLTYEEFSNTGMTYTFGLRFVDGAKRLYRNNELGIQKETYTDYDESTMKWGESQVYFFLDGDPNEYANAAELYVAWFRKNFGEEE